MATTTLTVREQVERLLDGYEAGEATLRVGGLSLAAMVRLAASHGVTVYLPGEYHGRDCVVITDSCYAYAVGADGRPTTIAG